VKHSCSQVGDGGLVEVAHARQRFPTLARDRAASLLRETGNDLGARQCCFAPWQTALPGNVDRQAAPDHGLDKRACETPTRLTCARTSSSSLLLSSLELSDTEVYEP